MIEQRGSVASVDQIARELLQLDPEGDRFGRVFRATFDQLYDGQRTGRYRWDQLFKTEKTHFGTLIEINLQREFGFEDGEILDFRIAGHEVDCKYSFRVGGWMLPPESWGHFVMVATANDESASWSVGLVDLVGENLGTSRNRDGKATLSPIGRRSIRWLFRDASMPPNVLLQLPVAAVEAIFRTKRGQARVDELFRQAEGLRIHRSTIATVAQQHDYMKRVRYNGGSRSRLQKEGYLIPGGDYEPHRAIARAFGLAVPRSGEVVSFRVVRSDRDDVRALEIDGEWWRRAERHEFVSEPAPLLPSTVGGSASG